MKRSTALLFVFLAHLGACSSSSTPPATPAADSTSSSSAAPVASGAPAAGSPAPSAEPSAASTAGPKTTMTMTPGVAPSAAPDAPPPGSDQPPPPASTTQKGILHQQLAGTEVVFITVTDASATCATDLKKASKGERRLEVQTLWKTGFYTLSSKTGKVRFDQYQGSTWQKTEAAGDGGVQVRAAPTAQGSTGRIHVQAKRQGESVDVELEVAVCAAVDLTKKPKK